MGKPPKPPCGVPAKPPAPAKPPNPPVPPHVWPQKLVTSATQFWVHDCVQHAGSKAQMVWVHAVQVFASGAPVAHWSCEQVQAPQSKVQLSQLSPAKLSQMLSPHVVPGQQSCLHELQLSLPLQRPSPQIGVGQQSKPQLSQLSPAVQTPSPQTPGQQSPGQVEQVSNGLHVPLPQAGFGQQSAWQVEQLSPGLQTASPHLKQLQSPGQFEHDSVGSHTPLPHTDGQQSAWHVPHDSNCASHVPLPQIGFGQQSGWHVEQLSPAPQTASPHTGVQQSAGQFAQLSPTTHCPSPQLGFAQQSPLQLWQLSPGSQNELPQVEQQSPGQLPQDSPGSQKELPHWASGQQSTPHEPQVSLFWQMASPHTPGQQSPGQVPHDSGDVHLPSPHVGGQQSLAQVEQLSPDSQEPFPQTGPPHPQALFAALTHALSHIVLQQNGSAPQTVLLQSEHVGLSGPPSVHASWEHMPHGPQSPGHVMHVSLGGSHLLFPHTGVVVVPALPPLPPFPEKPELPPLPPFGAPPVPALPPWAVFPPWPMVDEEPANPRN
jgi:hypothetical protein